MIRIAVVEDELKVQMTLKEYITKVSAETKGTEKVQEKCITSGRRYLLRQAQEAGKNPLKGSNLADFLV